jgi:hypothetical protein
VTIRQYVPFVTRFSLVAGLVAKTLPDRDEWAMNRYVRRELLRLDFGHL